MQSTLNSLQKAASFANETSMREMAAFQADANASATSEANALKTIADNFESLGAESPMAGKDDELRGVVWDGYPTPELLEKGGAAAEALLHALRSTPTKSHAGAA